MIIEVVARLAVCGVVCFQAGCSKRQEVEPIQTGEPSKPPEAELQSVTGNTVLQKTSKSAREIVELFKFTGDRETAYAAIREYAEKHPASLAELSSLLRSGDADYAVLGAQGLVKLATPQAATELIAGIQNTPAGPLRRELSGALSEFNQAEAAEVFFGQLRSSQDREMVSAVQTALGNSATDALLSEAVKRYRTSNSGAERDNLIAAIRHMQSPECVDGLLSVLNEQRVVSTTEPLSFAVADTLGIIGTTTAVSNLFQHLSSLREGASSPVYDAIGRVSNPEALPLIAAVAYGRVAGSSLYSRMAAVQALGNFSSNAVFPVLNWLLENDQNSGIRGAAGNALQRAAGR